MADQFRYKLMTDLTAKADPSDTDLFAVGNNGSSGLRKLTFASIANAIKTKLLTWTFTNLTTSSKTLPGAVNELNSKMPLYAKTIYAGDGSFTITVPNITSKYYFLLYGIKNTSPFIAAFSIDTAHEHVLCTDSSLTCTIANKTTITISGIGNYSSVTVFSPVAI